MLAVAMLSASLTVFTTPVWGADRLRSLQTGLSVMRAGAPAPPAVVPSSPLLGIVDSAADLTHPDLAHGHVRMATGASVVDGHGTAVSSIAAAAADGEGIEGMWPGMRVLIVPTDFSCDDAARGVRAAVDAGARVVLMSYETARCHAHREATQYAAGRDVVLLAAAGNDADPATPSPATEPHVITIGALEGPTSVARFSERTRGLDLMAPGVGVPAALPSFARSVGLIPGWDYVEGTSFAAAFAAGAAAWVRAIRPRLDAEQVGEVLRASATPLRGGLPTYRADSGYGRLNLAAALKAAAPARDAREPDDDLEWVDGRDGGKPAPALWTWRRGPRAVRGWLRGEKDHRDVHRLLLCPGDEVSVRLSAVGRTPVRLRVLDQTAQAADDVRARLAQGVARGRSSVTRGVRWRGRTVRTIYAIAESVGSTTPRAARYDLAVWAKHQRGRCDPGR